MYLYYDRNGNLKEQLNSEAFRVGNSNWNKIYVYYEGLDSNVANMSIKYRLPDGTNTQESITTTTQTTQIPYNEKQDLKFFKYYQNYTFYVFTVPDTVLELTGAVKVSMWVNGVGSSRIVALGETAFMVAGTTNFLPDEYISLAQWAELKLLIGTDTERIDDLEDAVEELETDIGEHIADLDNPHQVSKAQVGLGNVVNKPMDATPTADSTNYVSSGGVKAYVDNADTNLQTQINNISAIGRFLSIWNATTGTPQTEPPISTYTYKVGDYFIVGTSGTRNPKGASTYVIGQTNYVEGSILNVGDTVRVSTIVGTTATWVIQRSDVGNAIEHIQINGVEQTITNKTVNLPAYPTKTSLGLNNVDNTSDLNKPISTATQTALNAKQNTLTAGVGIDITNNVISNTQTSAEWGNITGTLSSQTDLQTALNGKANSADLSNVATSGDYNDLTNKPAINDGTLTIQKNGTTVDTFTANSSTNKTVNITVPTNNNELTNGAGYIIASDIANKEDVSNKKQTVDTSSTTDYLSSKAVADFVNSSINALAAFYITKNANGDPFSTRAELMSATTFYSGGVIRTPSRNDYCIVIADENHNGDTTRYIYNNGWEFQYVFNYQFTQAQTNAINSGIDSSKVAEITANTAKVSNVQADWNATSGLAQVLNKPTLSTVATSGDYDDLTNKPDLTTKMDKANPTGTGSLSLNRATGSTVGSNSVAVGNNNIAKGNASLAEGRETTANGYYSHAGGYHTTANRKSQHVFGEYNVIDNYNTGISEKGQYIEIVGKGVSEFNRSNARTLDWDGNEVLAGNITSTGFIKNGGTSSQFLKADGSVDNTTYITNSVNDLTNYTKTNDLSTVATSGNYNDLSNKPTIPTVNNPTINFTQGGVNKGSFTLNQSSGTTIALDAGGGGALYLHDCLVSMSDDTIWHLCFEDTTPLYNSSTFSPIWRVGVAFSYDVSYIYAFIKDGYNIYFNETEYEYTYLDNDSVIQL